MADISQVNPAFLKYKEIAFGIPEKIWRIAYLRACKIVRCKLIWIIGKTLG